MVCIVVSVSQREFSSIFGLEKLSHPLHMKDLAPSISMVKILFTRV